MIRAACRFKDEGTSKAFENKGFVQMLEALGYDIQLIPESKEERQWLEKQNFKNTAEDAYTG